MFLGAGGVGGGTDVRRVVLRGVVLLVVVVVVVVVVVGGGARVGGGPQFKSVEIKLCTVCITEFSVRRSNSICISIYVDRILISRGFHFSRRVIVHQHVLAQRQEGEN